MNRISTALGKNKKGLVIFLTVGDPSMNATVDLVKSAEAGGADVIELGVPFSDPLADGPVIQESFHRAIGKGATLTGAISAVKTIRKSSEIPLVFMLVSTLVINHGTAKFMKEVSEAGLDGLILPDVPVDESEEFVPLAKKSGLDTIILAAPTSTPARIRRIVKKSSGFVYYINVTGVTGKSSLNTKSVGASIARIKKITKLPVLSGFGISSPEKAGEMAKLSDGVIVGSQAIRVVRASKNNKDACKNLEKFVRSIRNALDKP